ncbi:AraC family transcriptional regulator [Ruminococcus sp. HUN007]|uniref:AraC family transcriptional regulator n=1 Tax=Ruminococcus sp. HUN007 TaxID=1514668 RepID=UPI0005D20B4B|nr:AraC family transcriptional regulator [Ruminococcus sp. HUN007]
MHSLFEKQDSLNAPVETFVYDTDKMPFPVKPHWHYFAEFLYILDGSAEITCDERTYTVGKNEFIILFPSAVHSISHSSEELKLFTGIKFDTAKFPGTSSYTPSVSSIFRYAAQAQVQIHFSAAESERFHCREIFTDCLDESTGYRYGSDVIQRAQIYRLIFAVVRYWMENGLDMGKCPVTSSDICGIENVTEFIDSELDGDLRVADIARKCHMSYSGFAAKFHESYGMSCKEYIERMRIYKAEEYLVFTDYDLTFISERTGFADSSHLIRSFRKYRGLTPKQFRMQKKRSDQGNTD